MKLVLMVLIVVIIFNPYRGLGDTESYNGEPQYAIKVQTSDTTLNPGNPFKMELFITGAGDINLSRISISIPEYIVKDRSVKLTSVNYGWIDPKNMLIGGKLGVQNETPGFYLVVPNIFYMSPAESPDTSLSKPMIFGESQYQINGTYYAPYTIDFVVANNATAGDREISINYMYKHINKWYQDTKTIRLHVNHWYETEFWRTVLELGAILGIALSLLLIKRELWSGGTGTPTGTTDDPMAKLTKLKNMLDGGLITQEEYDKKKTEILSSF